MYPNNKQSLRMRPRGASIMRKILLLAMVAVMMIVLQNYNLNAEAKALKASKKTLKLLKGSPSLIQLRHKRQADDYEDENADVIPDMSAGNIPPSLGDQISERAKQVADSFANMWQSLTDSVRHCVDALRGLFSDEEYELTPEQEEELLAAMEREHREKTMRDNEIYEYTNVYENQL